MYFNYLGQKVYFEVEGEGDPIVFLHGWGSDLNVFRSASAFLQKKYKCILVDLPGFGKSSELFKPLTIKDYGLMVLNLCDFLNIKEFFTISHSFGGRIVFYLLSEHGSRAKKSLMICPAGVKEKRKFKTTLKGFYFKFLKKIVKKEKLSRFYSADYLNSSGNLRKTFLNAINFNETSLLSNIHEEVLVIRGEKDTAVTLEMVTIINRKIKNSRVITLDGGHFCFVQNNISFRLILESFFD